MNRTVSTTNYTNEMIVPENIDLSWSQKSASLQRSEIRRSMITKKNHAILQGWHLTDMWKALA